MERRHGAGLAGRRVLIIGATGFIGSHLVEYLAGHGAVVFCAARRIDLSTQPALGLTWFACDASDPEQVSRIFRQAAPDIVYQLTSESFGGQDLSLIPNSIRNDLVATLNVLTEAAARKTRVILAGSFEEPDGAVSPTPSSPYAAAKWAAGGYARMISALHGLEVVCLRLMMVYGPRQKEYKVVPYLINKLLRDETADLSACERHLDWIFIDDVVAALAAAGEKPWRDSGAIDIGSGRMVRLRVMLQAVADMMGKTHLVRFGTAVQRKMEREGAADNCRASDILGWAPTTSFDQGMLKTIDYYRASSAAS